VRIELPLSNLLKDLPCCFTCSPSRTEVHFADCRLFSAKVFPNFQGYLFTFLPAGWRSPLSPRNGALPPSPFPQAGLGRSSPLSLLLSYGSGGVSAAGRFHLNRAAHSRWGAIPSPWGARHSQNWVDAATAQLVTADAQLVRVHANFATAHAQLVTSSAQLDTATAQLSQFLGKLFTSTKHLVTASVQPGTASPQPGTASAQPGTASAQPVTAIVQPGTASLSYRDLAGLSARRKREYRGSGVRAPGCKGPAANATYDQARVALPVHPPIAYLCTNASQGVLNALRATLPQSGFQRGWHCKRRAQW